MKLPDKLRWAVEKEAEGISAVRLKEISCGITEKYKSNREDGGRLVTGGEEATVYAIVRMPATFCAISDALRHTAELITGETFDEMLDVGAGTGAAVWAAAEVCGIRNAVCLERENAMLSMGTRLTAEEISGVNTRWVQGDLTSYSVNGKCDLVTAAYVFNELTPQSREETLRNLWEHTEKLLLIVEPGTPSAAKLQTEIRGFMAKLGAKQIAPCPEGASCRLSEGDWCHFTCRVERSKLHKLAKDADAPYEDEKYTYSAFYKMEGAGCKERVLRRPQFAEKTVTLKICSANGIEEKTLRKKDGSVYKIAKKSDAGDRLS